MYQGPTALAIMDGWLGFNGILSTQVAAISCLRTLAIMKDGDHSGQLATVEFITLNKE